MVCFLNFNDVKAVPVSDSLRASSEPIEVVQHHLRRLKRIFEQVPELRDRFALRIDSRNLCGYGKSAGIFDRSDRAFELQDFLTRVAGIKPWRCVRLSPGETLQTLWFSAAVSDAQYPDGAG